MRRMKARTKVRVIQGLGFIGGKWGLFVLCESLSFVNYSSYII